LPRRFIYLRLRPGTAARLSAGAKLILAETPVGKLPVWLTLGVVALTLVVSIGWSLLVTGGPPPKDQD
jgi:tellurite resistance protein TerC